MHYKNSSLHSIDVDLDKLNAKMHIHPMRFQNFRGVFITKTIIYLLKISMGKWENSFYGYELLFRNNSKIRRDNHIGLKANYIDFDQPLILTQLLQKKKAKPFTSDVSEHSEAFNLYELPLRR